MPDLSKVEIYYYSGTGNSLHVARELQKRISGTELIPIVSLLSKDIIETSGETIGFIFPINLSTVPVIVRRFLRKLDLKSSKYIFAVATRCGYPGPCPPHVALERILKKYGKRLNSFFMVNMLDNSPTGLKPSFVPSNRDWAGQITGENIVRVEYSAQVKLDKIQKVIMNKEEYCERDLDRSPNSFVENLLSLLVEYSSEHSSTEINFYADQYCSGCGICEEVCLSNKIKLINNRPVWQKSVKCYSCYACFNFCPEQSILISNSRNSYTEKNGRYFHPGISAKDIAGQKGD